ncbi:precorrin-8X methylmutase [Aureimonas sp. AU40]|uniref:precorrin-8X methylmutase n=1 Tax=Aureimonas sp. AU40 TaxID=1637747 RepID=UPI000AE61226|nr:precorrin-8X methylmutase [Aureimonas sp. AU40]
MALDYVRDPAAIYEASFATIRREAAPLLARLPEGAQTLAIRLAHSCGMVEIIEDLRLSVDAVAAGRAALAAGAPILVDAEMVAHGVIRRHLPAGNAVLCRLNEPEVAPLAARLGTTRSAAQVDLWVERGELSGAVVAIGNAPTALFRLLELLDEGVEPPAAILGFPVGFVGAAESKAELFAGPRGVPFATLLGRRGGSALAAAAVNALATGLATGAEPLGGWTERPQSDAGAEAGAASVAGQDGGEGQSAALAPDNQAVRPPCDGSSASAKGEGRLV